jgi:hypothetical protein
MSEHASPESATPETGGGDRCRHPRGRRIKTSHMVILGAVIVTGIAAAVTGIRAADRAAGAPTGVMMAGWQAGWHGHGRHHMARRLCSDERDAWIEDKLELVESFVDFDDEQRPAWDALAEAVRAGSGRVGESCAGLDLEALPASAPARLEQMELMLSTGLDVVREVRPAFEQFYAVLDDQQKAALDRLTTRHRDG